MAGTNCDLIVRSPSQYGGAFVPQATNCGRRDAMPWVRLLCSSSSYLAHVLLSLVTRIMKQFQCTSLGSKYLYSLYSSSELNRLSFVLVAADTLIVWSRNARWSNGQQWTVNGNERILIYEDCWLLEAAWKILLLFYLRTGFLLLVFFFFL